MSRVYQAISEVAADLAKPGLAKSMTNPEEGYGYRSIDELMNRLSPILSARKLCVLPRVLERTALDRLSPQNDTLVSVTLKVAFDLVSPEDGSHHTIEVYGEALDRGDKATAKALSSAYKSAMLQTFCVPLVGMDDAGSFKLKKTATAEQRSEPVQGWEQWVQDVSEVIASCATLEAIDRVQETNRALLRALSRERPELYTRMGEIFSAKRQQLCTPAKKANRVGRRKNGVAGPITTTGSKGNGAAAPLH
jgi:hypothetical protein